MENNIDILPNRKLLKRAASPRPREQRSREAAPEGSSPLGSRKVSPTVSPKPTQSFSSAELTEEWRYSQSRYSHSNVARLKSSHENPSEYFKGKLRSSNITENYERFKSATASSPAASPFYASRPLSHESRPTSLERAQRI